MVVNAADGSAYVDPTESSPARIVGGVVASSTPPGDPITLRGGGNVVIAGLTERDGTGGVVMARCTALSNWPCPRDNRGHGQASRCNCGHLPASELVRSNADSGAASTAAPSLPGVRE